MRGMLSSSSYADTVAARPPGAMSLSNVKRLFRLRFHVELNETALGHSKLLAPRGNTRFRYIYVVQLYRKGYVVVPRAARGARGVVQR